MSDPPPDRTIHDPVDAAGEPAPRIEGEPRDPDRRGVVVAGAAFLTTGLALVVHVLVGIPLPLVLATAVLALAVLGAVLHRDRPASWWGDHADTIRIGVLAGIVSTVAYDLSRWLLVWAADLPSSPYAAFPFFGRAIVGSDAPDTVVAWTGTAFHLVNGIVFATAYTIWFGRRPWWTGILFGLGLEVAMLAIYPGWLDIRAIGEFTSISVLGHVCYGATLGGMVAWLRR